MLENTTLAEELAPSAEQLQRAELLIEETLEIEEDLEAVAEAEVVEETRAETVIAELDEVTVVETEQITPELSVNIKSEILPEAIVQSATSIDTAGIINNVRSEAIANFGSDLIPTIDIDVNSLTAIPEAALKAEARIAPIDAVELSILPPIPTGIFDIGTAGDDFLIGTPFDDFLFAGGGDDIVIGLPGNDRIFGEADNDFLIGGLGNDIVDGGAGDDLIFGEDSRTAPNDGGKDLIRGGDGLDVVFAGGNNDTVFGDNGDDVIFGEAGRDILNGGNGNDVVNGGDGNDRLFGDSGNDLLDGGSGSDRINAEDGDDVANGGSGADTIFGGRGNDTLDGGRGRDSILGGTGNDLIIGGNGNDTISGVDSVSFRPGFDEIDTLEGGAGRDLFVLGDDQNFFYDDGRTISIGDVPIGLGDYGLIKDFEIGTDSIQLNGSADQYILEQAQDEPFNSNDLPTGTAIYRKTSPIIIFDPPFPRPIPFPFPEPFPQPFPGRPFFNPALISESEEFSSIDIEPIGDFFPGPIIPEPIPVEPSATIELVGVVQDIDPSQLSLTNSSQFTFV